MVLTTERIKQVIITAVDFLDWTSRLQTWFHTILTAEWETRENKDSLWVD